MKLRKLRIAWSVAWGVVALLLCLLWVRSYWRCDYIFRNDVFGPYSVVKVIGSEGGYIYFKRDVQLGGALPSWWAVVVGELAQPVNSKQVNGPRSRKIMFRQLLLAPILVALAAIPWLPYRRFSLRTLLIATTLVAVVLGLIVWAGR